MRGIPQLARDWRIRTLVPAILINLAAFGVLYALMYHFAISNMVRTQKAAGAVLLNEIEISFPDLMRSDGHQYLRARIARAAAIHNLADMSVYDARSRPTVTTYGTPPAGITDAVRMTLAQPGEETQWIVSPGDRSLLIGIRPLLNRDNCRGCHETGGERLGALQMSIDMTGPMNDMRALVRRRFALAGTAWIALLALMFWTGGVVIGRPLRRIQKALTAADTSASASQDLEALASRVDQTIWTLIAQQRKREEDISRHMARAEQLAALGELAAGLTHEIKSPLAGVISALEALREERHSGDEIVDQMLGELRRVTTTVDSLLRLAKPQPPRRTDVDLGKCVHDVASVFAARFRRQSVTLRVETSDNIPILPLDGSLMTQVLVNLLTNSLQATDRGGTVTIIVAPFPRHDGVVLAVADTGKGINAEDIRRIFDPFFTTKEEGTGLGLAICRQIVEQHGGTISVESEPGKGTRIIVLLPDARALETEGRHGLAAAG